MSGQRHRAQRGDFVVTSELEVPSGGEAGLEAAFAHRLGAVDAWPGFVNLEVWRDGATEGRYLLVTWWRARADYMAYMRSEEHSTSHARVPSGALAPAAVAVRRFEVVAQ